KMKLNLFTLIWHKPFSKDTLLSISYRYVECTALLFSSIQHSSVYLNKDKYFCTQYTLQQCPHTHTTTTPQPRTAHHTHPHTHPPHPPHPTPHTTHHTPPHTPHTTQSQN